MAKRLFSLIKSSFCFVIRFNSSASVFGDSEESNCDFEFGMLLSSGSVLLSTKQSVPLFVDT